MMEGKESFIHKDEEYTVPSLEQLLEHTVNVGSPCIYCKNLMIPYSFFIYF